MRGAMIGLAAGCVALGVAAGPVGAVFAGVARDMTRSAPAIAAGTLEAPRAMGVYDPALLSLALVGLLVGVFAVARIGARPARRAPTWTCGILPEPAFEYTATSFSKPLRLFFEPILRPARELHVELHEGTPFPRRITYRSEVDHLFESRVYGPLHRASVAFAQLARRLQQGTLQLYLAYTVGAVIVLLLVARR